MSDGTVSETKELVVMALHPGVDRVTVEAATGWGVRFSDNLRETPLPTEPELEVLRDLHARTGQAHRNDMIPRPSRQTP